MILRTKDYHWAKSHGVWWSERLINQTPMTKEFNKIYSRNCIVIDVGFPLAGG